MILGIFSNHYHQSFDMKRIFHARTKLYLQDHEISTDHD